jgi:hypothetical protein
MLIITPSDPNISGIVIITGTTTASAVPKNTVTINTIITAAIATTITITAAIAIAIAIAIATATDTAATATA